MSKHINKILAFLFIIVLFISCSSSDSPTKSGTFYGSKVAVGDGFAQAWVKLDDNGYPVSVGLTMDETTLNNLADMMKEFILTFPTEGTKTPFNHIGLDWNPSGHEPSGVYDLPHFDMHFYLISQDARNLITVQGADTLKVYKAIPAQNMPVGYIMPPGTGVPTMGAHAFDASAPELSGSKFTETFIYGFYDGNMVFLEPMITNEYLKTKANLTKDLKLPAKYPSMGYFPTKYSITFDATTKKYNISLDVMVNR